jgi:hypothetical protein
VSPRRNRPKGGDRPSRYDAENTGIRFGLQRTESWQGEKWSVRHVAGGSAPGKHYRCPGCDQEIPPGVPHVVAWSEYAGVDDRRHWHKACWNAKDRRTTRLPRSRNAPRY